MQGQVAERTDDKTHKENSQRFLDWGSHQTTKAILYLKIQSLRLGSKLHGYHDH